MEQERITSILNIAFIEQQVFGTRRLSPHCFVVATLTWFILLNFTEMFHLSPLRRLDLFSPSHTIVGFENKQCA